MGKGGLGKGVLSGRGEKIRQKGLSSEHRGWRGLWFVPFSVHERINTPLYAHTDLEIQMNMQCLLHWLKQQAGWRNTPLFHFDTEMFFASLWDTGLGTGYVREDRGIRGWLRGGIGGRRGRRVVTDRQATDSCTLLRLPSRVESSSYLEFIFDNHP